MFNKIGGFFKYIISKGSEVKDLTKVDIYMTKTVLAIHTLKKDIKLKNISLYSLKPIHPLDRDNAQGVMEHRVKILKKAKMKILADNKMSQEELNKYIPSVSWIKVVKDKDGKFYVFEGNGRLASLKKVFDKKDKLKVEVEHYELRKSKKVLKMIKKLTKLNGLTK